MSVTVEFSDIDGGDNLKLVVPYEYGDYNLTQTNITCPVLAERQGNNFIRILEEDREKFSGQQSIKFKDYLSDNSKDQIKSHNHVKSVKR